MNEAKGARTPEISGEAVRWRTIDPRLRFCYGAGVRLEWWGYRLPNRRVTSEELIAHGLLPRRTRNFEKCAMQPDEIHYGLAR